MDLIYVLYVAIGLVLGIIVLLIIHYVGDFPFPWQIRIRTARASEPDSLALSECFDKLSHNEEIHMVMGNVSALVCEQDIVISSMENALEKNVVIKLVHGPEVDNRSERFLGLLRENTRVELYEYPTYPELHFRVLIDEEGPREVYVEEPHLPYEDHGFRCFPSRRASHEYEKIFQGILRRSARL